MMLGPRALQGRGKKPMVLKEGIWDMPSAALGLALFFPT